MFSLRGNHPKKTIQSLTAVTPTPDPHALGFFVGGGDVFWIDWFATYDLKQIFEKNLYFVHKDTK